MKTKTGLFVPSPLQTRILEHLKDKGRASAQELQAAVESTVGSVRDSLNTLRKHGLVTKSPVSFELAKKSPRAKKAKEQVEG